MLRWTSTRGAGSAGASGALAVGPLVICVSGAGSRRGRRRSAPATCPVPGRRRWPGGGTAPQREKGGEPTGHNLTDRGKHGTKYHLLCDANGLTLHALISGANTHDSVLFEPLLDTNPAVRGRRGHPGRPRRRPDKLHADKGYDYRRCRAYLTRCGIKVRIARRGIEDKTKLGRVRWVVERTISWLLRFKRLALRYDRTLAPLLTLAMVLINLRRLIQHEI